MDKYLKEFKKEEKKTNFFSTSNSTAVAVDVSGSTGWNNAMQNQKKVISDILSGTNCQNLENNILAWDHDVTIQPLKDLKAYGGTDPSVIFDKLGKNIENLVVTTDGEISSSEVNKTRDRIKAFTNLKNIICLSFQSGVNSPSNLNIAVFYPFLEHTRKMKGSFYLFFYKDEILYLLLKNIPINFETTFKSPPQEYTQDTKWEEIPSYKCEDLKNIFITSIQIEEGYIYIPNSDNLFNLNLLEKDVLDFKNKDDLSFVSSDEFNEFMTKNINSLIDACVDTYFSENFNKLRNIVSEWKKGIINKIKEKEKEKENDENIREKNKKIELYNELTKKKFEIKDKKSEEFIKLIEQIKSLSKEIFPTVNEKLKAKINEEYITNKFIGDIQERITEEQNKLVNTEVINDFTLKNITKVANRVKRATKLNTIESAENWDLTGNPLLCDECLICTRNNQPMALLMIDLSVENPNLLEFNVSDFSLNDELNTGTKNTSAIPAGEFCIECAYAMMLLGKHPITRQKIGSVLVLADPTIKKNIADKNTKPPFIMKLNEDIILYNKTLISILDSLLSLKQFIIERIKFQIKECLYSDSFTYKIDIYGSFKSHLDIVCSDIDMVFIPKKINKVDISNLIQRLSNHLLSTKEYYKVTPIYTASIPLIKLMVNYENYLTNNKPLLNDYSKLIKSDLYKNYPYDKEKEISFINIDISFPVSHNNKKNKNSPFLQIEYIKNSLEKYPDAGIVIRILKRALKLTDMNNSYKGGLSSYTLFLIVISFLKNNNKLNGINNNKPKKNSFGHAFHDTVKFFSKFDFYSNIIDIENKNGEIFLQRNQEYNTPEYENVPIILDPVTRQNAGKSSFRINDVQKTIIIINEELEKLRKIYDSNNDNKDNTDNKDNSDKNLVITLLKNVEKKFLNT